MEEAFAVGKAKGVALDPAYIDDRMDFVVNKVEPGMKASMAHDLERGNRLELDWLAGKVRALGTRVRHPDAGERHGLYRAQAAPHGIALTQVRGPLIAHGDLSQPEGPEHCVHRPRRPESWRNPRQELTPVPGAMAPA